MERLIEVFRDGGVVNINSFLHLIASDQIWSPRKAMGAARWNDRKK